MATPIPAPVPTTLQTIGGQFICAEGGGGGIVVADRTAVGPWETFTVITHDDGRVSLQTHTGHWLSAKPDGTVDAAPPRPGDDPAIYPGEWERWTYERREGAGVAFLSHHGMYLSAELGGGGLVVADRMPGPTIPGAWEFFTPSAEWWVPPAPPFPVSPRPFVGPLRIENKLFRDDTGYRRVFFCSWFPALRILRDNPAEFDRQINAIAAAGFQGFRTFAAVGGWDDYWNGREVAPVKFQKWFFTGNHLRTDEYSYWVDAWPDYDDLLRRLLRACRERHLRVHLCTGDMQVICPGESAELDLHKRIARICADEGGTDVVALAETTNEYPLNRYGGDSDESVAQMGRILDAWSTAIPGVLTAQGAIPANEEPDSLYRASTHGNTCAVHVSRDPFGLCLKRTLGLVYWEGDYRAFPKPFWEGEPAGPGEDSYCRQDDPANLVALYAMHALTGQASNWFQGAAVRSFAPLESEWGFTTIAHLLAEHLPEDVATWDHGSNGHGGVEYWWRGNDFRTAVFTEWDPTPPRPVASWTLYTGTQVIPGTGTSHLKGTPYAGGPRGTGLLVGKFA